MSCITNVSLQSNNIIWFFSYSCKKIWNFEKTGSLFSSAYILRMYSDKKCVARPFCGIFTINYAGLQSSWANGCAIFLWLTTRPAWLDHCKPRTSNCTILSSLGGMSLAVLCLCGCGCECECECVWDIVLEMSGKQSLIHVSAARSQDHRKKTKQTYLTVTAQLKPESWKNVHAVGTQNTLIGLLCYCLNKEWQYHLQSSL